MHRLRSTMPSRSLHEEAGLIHALFVADSRLIEAPYRRASMPEIMVTETDPTLTQSAVVASRHLAEYGAATLADAKDRCRTAGVACETEYVKGIVANVILKRTEDANLVVMGRRGEGAEWAGPRSGSVLESIVRYAQAPVLAVQAEVRPIKRILVAFDGSERAVDALKVAAEMASRQQRFLVVLTVNDGVDGRHRAWEMGREILADRGQKSKHLFVTGHATATILKLAVDEKCDLIALGSYGHGHFVEIVFGSTVDEVLHRAVSPVLICR